VRVKDYRILARLKNNRLWDALRTTWPDVVTQSDAARRLGCAPGDIGDLLNMSRWPYRQRPENLAGWTPLATKIAEAVQETEDYLFDPVLYGRPPRRVELEIDHRQLLDAGVLALPEPPDEAFERTELQDYVARALQTLTPREQDVLQRRCGFGGAEPQTLREIADAYDRTPGRIRDIEAKALRKLRHPARSKRLRPWVYPDEPPPVSAPRPTQDPRIASAGPLHWDPDARHAQWLLEEMRPVSVGEVPSFVNWCYCDTRMFSSPLQWKSMPQGRYFFFHRAFHPSSELEYCVTGFYAPQCVCGAYGLLWPREVAA
jgi:RNA polymerase sigma factor (sigma-70 family)